MSQKRSRVQKHADLRDSIMSDVETRIETKELSSFASKLHQIDDNHFEEMKVDVNQETHLPLHLRQSFQEEKEFSVDNFSTEKLDSLYEESSVELIEDTDSFKSDYLQDFIEEAKQYNVEKGFRVDHDTRSNLLRELRAQHIVTEEEEFELLHEDIEDELLETEADSYPIEEKVVEEVEPIEDTIMMRVAEYSESPLDSKDYAESNGNTGLLEATTKLQIQMEEQDQYAKDMGNKLDQTNRVMNVLLTMLGIFLIAIILVIGYLILVSYEII